MFHDIAFALWFLLPAAVANATPVFAAALPILKQFEAPLDFGKSLGGHRIFGSHKTWRGLISGILVATLVLWLQQWIVISYPHFLPFLPNNIDYSTLPTLLLGPLFGIGARGGDAIESFFKRKNDIKSGHSWLPFDQLDYVVGSVAISLFFVILTPWQYVWIFVVWFLLHLIASYLGYRLGLKDEPI